MPATSEVEEGGPGGDDCTHEPIVAGSCARLHSEEMSRLHAGQTQHFWSACESDTYTGDKPCFFPP